MISNLTPAQFALLGLQIRQRNAIEFVRQIDGLRLGFSSVQTEDAARVYRRLRRQILEDGGFVESERRVLTPSEATRQQQALEHPVPAMFRGAPPEFWRYVRVTQRKTGR